MKLSLNSLAERAAQKLDESNTKEMAEVLYGELQKQRKVGLMSQLLEMIEQKVCEKDGMVLAKITSARELTEIEIAELEERLGKRTGQKIAIKNTVDEKLIGGIKIIIKDEIIDLSLRGALNSLNAKLTQA
jgi:F-type H+-transporting ATPase subunit delta